MLDNSGKQNVKLKNGSISFKNYFKQLPVPFKIYADFECILKKVECDSIKNNSSYTEKYQSNIPCSFAYKVDCIDNKFSKKVLLYREKNAAYKFIEATLSEYSYCTGVIKKHFNKNLIMSTEEEEKFQLANSFWICDKLLDVGDDKVRDHYHITGKYRGTSHWSFNIDLKMSKKIPVIFDNLRAYDSHLIIKEASKSDIKVSVIPNGLEKCMTFTINKNLVFIDSMQFMTSTLDSLVKNLSDHDFVCLSEEFSSEFLKLVKQKGVYPYEYMDSFEKFFEDKLLDKCEFFSSLKARCISEEYYFKATNVWNVFKMNTMGDYHDIY